MTVYSLDVVIHATLYVKAEDRNDLSRKINSLSSPDLIELHLMEQDAGGMEICGKRYNDPDLPEVSLSPAMTLGRIKSAIKAEEVD